MTNYSSRDAMLAAYGPFAIAFEPLGECRLPYLTLLNLHNQDASAVVDRISVVVSNESSLPFLFTLMKDSNWRPHLVGAVAILFRDSEEVIEQTWKAINAGSWVTPQLLAVLSLRDGHFFERGTQQLRLLCPVQDDSEYLVDDPVERHVARGPAGSYHRSSKAAASLLALLETDHPNNELVHQLACDSKLSELISEDYDNSAEIAVQWREQIVELAQTSS